MAANVSLFLALLLLTTTPTPALTNNAQGTVASSNSTEFIRVSCGATLYPDLCFASLVPYVGLVQRDPVRLARASANVSLARVYNVLDHMSALRPEASAALRDCREQLGDAADQTRRSVRELVRLEDADGPDIAWRVSNVQTWMSAALTNEDTCADGLHKASSADIGSRVRLAKRCTSNALALTNRLVAS